MDALSASGRTVSLATLAGWRKEGLLPPLASHGLGTGKGKSYYWREPDIVGHAYATYDLLRKYGRPETALWMLWLSGYSVPLRQFRRVWAHRGRVRALWSSQPAVRSRPDQEAAAKLELASLQGQGGTTHILFQALLAFADALTPDDGDSTEVVRVIGAALTWVSKINAIPTPQDDRAAEKLWLAVRVMAATLESSDLVAIASDAELRQAQHYLQLVGDLLQRCSDRYPERLREVWPTWLADRMAGPIFLLILVLLRSGHKVMLDEIAAKLEKPNRRAIRPPVQPAYSALRV